MKIPALGHPRPAVNILAIAAILLGGSVLLYIGFMVAVVPEVILRLLPFVLIFVVVLLAMLGRSDKAVGEKMQAFWISVLLTTMALWPSYLLVKVGGLPALDARRIVAGLSLLAAIYCVVGYRPVSRALLGENRGVLQTGCWIVTLYAVWRILSSFVSPAPIASLIQVSWEILYYYSFFFLGFLFFSAESMRDKAHRVLLWLMLIIAAYAVVERILGKNPMVQWAPSNEEFEATARAMTLSRIREGAYRTQSTFEHPLLLAEFSAMVACYAMAYVLWPAKRGGERILGFLALLCSLLAAYLSGSRSAFVSFGAGLGAVLVMRMIAAKQVEKASVAAMRKGMAICSLLAAVAVATPGVVVLMQGNTTGEASSTRARVVMLQLGLPAIQEKPVLGAGPGTGPSIAGLRSGDGLSTMDNYLLSIAIESGVPGLLLFLASLLYPAWIAFSRLASGAGSATPFLAATVGAMIAVLTMRSILWMPYNLSFAFILGGITLAQCVRMNSGGRP